MEFSNLNINTYEQTVKDLVMNPFLEESLIQLIKAYHSNKVREIISQNTDIFSVFHYERTELINEINGTEYWSVSDIYTLKKAVISSNKKFIVPFDNYNYIEKTDFNKIYCSSGQKEALIYDFNGNLIEGSLPVETPSWKEKSDAKNKFAKLIYEEIKNQPLDTETDYICRLKNQIEFCEENFEIVKQNTQKMEKSLVKHIIFDYCKSIFHCTRNKRLFSLKDKNTKKYGLVNAKGKLIAPFIYDDLNGFIGGEGEFMYTAKMTDNGTLFGLLDCIGLEVVKPISQEFILFYDGLGVIAQDGKYGYIDTTGKTVIPLIYDKAYNFMFGKAKVKQNGETFYINRKGEKTEE